VDRAERVRERFVSEQPPYSILTRGIEVDVLPTCVRYGMGVISYSPLAGGWLSGRYSIGTDPADPACAARAGGSVLPMFVPKSSVCRLFGTFWPLKPPFRGEAIRPTPARYFATAVMAPGGHMQPVNTWMQGPSGDVGSDWSARTRATA